MNRGLIEIMDLMESEGSGKGNKPLFTVDMGNPDEVLKWLKREVDELQKTNREFSENQKRNILTYLGSRLKEGRIRSTNSSNLVNNISNNGPNAIVNDLYDIVESKVAMMTRLKPAVDIIPTHNEHGDKIAAKEARAVQEHIWYLNNIDELAQKSHRIKYICGEMYFQVAWDKDIGDFTPAYAEWRKNNLGKKVVVTNDDGTVDEIDGPIRTGDVCYDILVPWRVLMRSHKNFNEVDHYIKVEVKDVDKLKLDYPDKANKIVTPREGRFFDTNIMESRQLQNEVIVYTLLHKKNKYLPEGAKIIFTDDVILEQSINPYEHGKLDIIHLTDISIPDILHGISFLEQLKPIQSFSDHLHRMVAKAAHLVAHPKWLLPKGAAKLESLSNRATIVEWRGNQPPQLLTPNPVSNDLLNLIDRGREDIQRIGAVHGVSRGQPPSGVTAAVALQFLNDQESERNSTDIAKHNEFIKQIAEMTLAVAGQFYSPDDGRTLRVLGEDGKFLVKQFDAASLHKPYDIRINVGSAFPKSKAAQQQFLIEAIQYDREGKIMNSVTPERFLDLLDIGKADKMISIMTAAIESAEAENEAMRDGKDIEVEHTEDHFQHLNVHYKDMQKQSYKDLPREIKAVFEEHIEVHEREAAEKMMLNPLFEAKMSTLTLFPMFYQPVSMPRSAEEQAVKAQTAANRGEPTNGVIPSNTVADGTEKE